MATHIWARFRRILRNRGAAAFLIAAVIVRVLVGLAAALLVTPIELVGDQAALVREGGSGWGGLGRWAAIIALPLGLMVAYLINRRWGYRGRKRGRNRNNGRPVPPRRLPADTHHRRHDCSHRGDPGDRWVRRTGRPRRADWGHDRLVASPTHTLRRGPDTQPGRSRSGSLRSVCPSTHRSQACFLQWR
jgi:hypothetical protein